MQTQLILLIGLALGIYQPTFGMDTSPTRSPDIDADKTDQGPECPICLNSYDPKNAASSSQQTHTYTPKDADALITLACTHAFHQACIAQWLTGKSKTCPNCRRPVVINDLTFLKCHPRTIFTLTCEHTFDDASLSGWVAKEKKKICPLCKKPINDEDIAYLKKLEQTEEQLAAISRYDEERAEQQWHNLSSKELCVITVYVCCCYCLCLAALGWMSWQTAASLAH